MEEEKNKRSEIGFETGKIKSLKNSRVMAEAPGKPNRKAATAAEKETETVLSAKIDAEVKELNKRCLQSNVKRSAEQLIVMKDLVQKEILKSGKTGARAMRAEGNKQKEIPQSTVSTILSSRKKDAVAIKRTEVEERKVAVPEKKVKKLVSIPLMVEEAVEMESEEEEESDEEEFGSIKEDDVRVEIPKDITAARGCNAAVETETISNEFLADVLSSDPVMDMERADDEVINVIARELEEPSREAGLMESTTQLVKQREESKQLGEEEGPKKCIKHLEEPVDVVEMPILGRIIREKEIDNTGKREKMTIEGSSVGETFSIRTV